MIDDETPHRPRTEPNGRDKPRPLVVHAYPAWKSADRNPYNLLLSQALTTQGCRVIDPGRIESFTSRADVVHIHWPQNQLSGGPVGLMRALRLVAMLIVQKMRGARLVWTVHNIKRHDGSRGSAERTLMWAVSRLLHGVIFLGNESRIPTYDALPALRDKPFAVIPHGLYGDLYPPPPPVAVARAQLGLPPDKTVIAFAGEIRPYKGVEALIEAFEHIADEACVLLVAGGFHDRRYGRLIADRIAQARQRGAQIVFREGWVSNDEMSAVVAAADFMVLPYQSSLNSGFAILTLELGARLLVPDAPVFRALQAELGTDWLRIMTGPLDRTALDSARTWAAERPKAAKPSFDKARAWEAIAQATTDFYKLLGAGQ